MWRCIFVGFCSLSLCVLSFSGPTGLEAQESRDYQIGSRDVLEITVYEEPDLSKKVRVSADGHISFPLLGEIEVAGLTAAQVERRLTELLAADYLVNPQVSVSVVEYKSKQVLVLGAVKAPGSFPLTGRATVLEMLSMAGGVDREEGGNALILLRSPGEGEGGETTSLTIDLKRLLEEGDISQNQPVQNNDVLYIPKSDSIYVFGEVQKPGPVRLSGKEITLLEALTQAGGPTKIAALNRTRIIRVVEGEEQVIKVKVDEILKSGKKSEDLVLKAGDIIVVPESYF